MPNNINFFLGYIFVFYDPLEFLTGASQTPTRQEMVISHLSAMIRKYTATLTYCDEERRLGILAFWKNAKILKWSVAATIQTTQDKIPEIIQTTT